MTSFWSTCLSQFEQELPPQQFNTWIRPLRLEGEEDVATGLRLLAPNGFILKWVKERYLARIEEIGSQYFSTPVDITLALGERTAAVKVTAPCPVGEEVTLPTSNYSSNGNSTPKILPQIGRASCRERV